MLTRVRSEQRTRLIMATNGELFHRDRSPLDRVRDIVLRSIEKKFGSLPIAAWDRMPFETSDGRVRATNFSLDGVDAWGIRFSEPCDSVSGRDWIVESSVLSNNDRAEYSCRLSCYSRDDNFRFQPSTPGVLKDVACQLSFSSFGYQFCVAPEEIGIDVQLDRVISEINNEQRWWNVIVTTESRDQRYAIDAERLQASVLGCANVYKLPIELEDEFSRFVGDSFGVYNGGARSFRPGFSKQDDEHTAHPVISAPWRGSDFQTDRALTILAQSAFDSSTQRADLRRLAPSFIFLDQVARSAKINDSRNSATVDEMLKLVSDENTALKAEVDEALDLGKKAEIERDSAKQALDSERAASFNLRARIEFLEASLNERSISTDEKLPQKYSELASWVNRNFAGKLRLAPRAERMLKTATYEKIEDICEALRLLATVYRNAKMGFCDHSKFVEGYQKLHLEESKSVSKSTAGQHGDEYYVVYGGDRVFLDRHLKKGTSKDRRRCMRIYYFFDDEAQTVVVGALPHHLDTSAT